MVEAKNDCIVCSAIPNITSDGNFFLLMKDDRGTMYDTPNFSLACKYHAYDLHTLRLNCQSQLPIMHRTPIPMPLQTLLVCPMILESLLHS